MYDICIYNMSIRYYLDTLRWLLQLLHGIYIHRMIPREGGSEGQCEQEEVMDNIGSVND